MSPLLFKDNLRGIPISPLGVDLIPKKSKNVSKYGFKRVYVGIFETMLFNKIN
jgi:hypothetical protein